MRLLYEIILSEIGRYAKIYKDGGMGLRIIAGNAKGRKLKSPDTQDIRPTIDRVREAVFSMINFEIPGSRVLDLFAGTGSLGLEAISRGACDVVFVDNNRQAIGIINDNIKLLGVSDRARVMQTDAFKAMEMLSMARERFDIIFIDPPYNENLYHKILLSIAKQDLAKKCGIIIIEHPDHICIEDRYNGLHIKKNKRYGSVGITIMINKGGEQ